MTVTITRLTETDGSTEATDMLKQSAMVDIIRVKVDEYTAYYYAIPNCEIIVANSANRH